MRHISDRFTAILDANVLYPFLVRDVLLSFYHAGLYRARWTEDIMGEWSSRLIRERPDIEDKIKRTIEVMNAQFPEALVTEYQSIIETLDLPDPDDRHVVAAAIRAGASVIVTENTKDFPPDALARYDIETRTADQFAVETFELYETDAVDAIRSLRARYSNPPKSPDELIISLIGSGLVDLANALAPHKASL